MDIVNQAIIRYKKMRSLRELKTVYNGCYAFVGMGSHSTENLFPVLNHLQVFPKWICCTSTQKALQIGQKYPFAKGTAVLDKVLNDEQVSGVFVSTSPKAHFELAGKVMSKGKSLFVEKPPCYSLAELERLIELADWKAPSAVMVGMQRRFSPLISLLQKHIKGKHTISYNYRYLTGAYPEGNPLYDLFIHPIDLVCHLFGETEVTGVHKVEKDGVITYAVLLKHQGIVGMLELSTAYSWDDAMEHLSINTQEGLYELFQMEELTYTPKRAKLFGVPLEKVFKKSGCRINLFKRNGFNPVLMNNQIVTQGYYQELRTFVESVERNAGINMLPSLRNTYKVLDALQHNSK